MKLIDKDALLKELGITDEECTKCEWGDGHGFCTRSADFTDACDAICTALTVEEHKKGKWTTKEGDVCFHDVCSECGRKYVHNYPWYNFCPNCGADMREQP